MVPPQIFLSHRSAQKAWLKARLIPKLEPSFTVWLDDRAIDPLAPITETVRQAIAASHLFLAWWFDGYEDSEPCHFELITALVHCRAEGEQSYQQRVFFAGPDAARQFPEAGIFKELLAPKLSTAPTEAEIDGLVNALKQRAANLDPARPFGAAKLDEPSRNALAPNTDFIGRSKELLQLFGRLHAARAGTEGGGDALALVSGIGGEGKTELAKEFARRFKAWYPGGVYRINLPGDAGDWSASAAAYDQALRDFADKLGVIRPQDATREFLRGRIGEKLTVPYLWLIDDLPSGTAPEDVESLLPPNGFGTCLLTSRATVKGLPEFPLDRLSPADGQRLLHRLCPRLADDMAVRLVEHVHGHALALSLIGYGIASGAAPEVFLVEQSPAFEPLETIARQLKLGGAKVRPVLATLLTSLSLIPADSSARPLLGLLARLAPDPVPDAFLREVIAPEELVPGLTWLTERGFLRAPIISDQPCRRLHPLLAEVVRALADDFGPADALTARLAAVDAVLIADLRAIYADAGHFRRAPLSPLLLPHSRHRAAAGLAREEPTLAAWLVCALSAVGDLPGARALQEQVLEICRRTLGSEHPNTLTSLNNLALTLSAQGDLPGARALEEQVLEARRRTLGPEHPATLGSLNSLALSLRAQGDLPGARALQEQALEAHRRTLGPEHPNTLRSLNNLAGTLSAQGDLPGARVLDEQALEARRRTLGPEHPDTLESLGNLASTLWSQGDLPAARALEEQVLEARCRTLGPEHPDTLTSLNNLASTLYDLGDLPGARALQVQALEARRRTLGPEHPGTLTSLNNLARTLADQGDLPGARVLEEQALEARRRTLGPEHPDTLTSLNNLAKTLCDLGETAAACDLVRPILPLLPTLAHAAVRAALTALARDLKLLPPEVP